MPTIIYKYLLCLTGILLALPALLLTVLAFTLPITFSGIGYLVACLLVISGLILAPWKRNHHLVLILAGGIVFCLIAGVRVFSGEQNTGSNLKMITLPPGTATHWVSYLIDEQDSLIFGEALFHAIGGDSQTEHHGITGGLFAAYSKMKIAQGVTPSPFVDTYLYFQELTSFDAILIDPKSNHHPRTGIIFLHGYMGNVMAQCWEIAQAVSKYGAITVCPSTGWQGEWWQPEGAQILRATFSYLREQGIQNIYLGGFSNGGFGISRLISKLGNKHGLSGLFFIDGIYDGVSIRATGLPVLIIQGLQDERMPATDARRIAAAIGDSGTYVELNSDHFLIMKQPDLVQEALSAWLENQGSNP